MPSKNHSTGGEAGKLRHASNNSKIVAQRIGMELDCGSVSAASKSEPVGRSFRHSLRRLHFTAGQRCYHGGSFRLLWESVLGKPRHDFLQSPSLYDKSYKGKAMINLVTIRITVLIGVRKKPSSNIYG